MPRPRSRYSRRRAASLAAVYLLMGLHIAHWKLSGRTLAPLELSEVLYTIQLGVVTAGFLFMACATLATTLVGRFFCSWGCHILALEDLCVWLLEKIGVHPRPVRSRVLAWVPFVAMAYLFLWPPLLRWLHGAPPPALQVIAGVGPWGSFVTSDLWRNLPGPWIATLSFVVCGGLVVYLLGSRGFCRNVCPYGAVFAVADRVAPGRIVSRGDCSGCGLCTAVCRSHVRVQDEVLRFGSVVDPGCLRDLDCVAVCPEGALRFGATRPPLLRGFAALRAAARPGALGVAEELCLAGVFAAVFFATRGLYEAVPFLLALALAASGGFVAVTCLRLARRPSVGMGGLLLRTPRSITARGRAFVVVAVLLGLLLSHSALVRTHEVLGMRAFRAVARGDASALARATALEHFEWLRRHGLVRPTSLRRRLASLHLVAGHEAEAERELRAVLAREPADATARRWLDDLLARRAGASAPTASPAFPRPG